MSFKINLKHTSFHISINSLGLYLSPECLLNFLSNLYIPPCVRKIFKFMVFAFLENALNLSIFTYAFPLPTQSSPPSSYHHTLGRGKLLIPSDSIIFNSRKALRKPWFTLSEFSQKIWRWLGTLGYLYSVWFVIFTVL